MLSMMPGATGKALGALLVGVAILGLEIDVDGGGVTETDGVLGVVVYRPSDVTLEISSLALPG